MLGRIIRIEPVSFDAKAGQYAARVTFAAPSGPFERQLRIPGHRGWGAGQLIAALKGSAQTA